jgi:matrixin
MPCIILALLALVAAWPATASNTALTGAEGHPRARLPLTIELPPVGDAELAAAMRRAVDDWNALARDGLGLEAFVAGAGETAAVRVRLEPATTSGLMGLTSLRVGEAGVIGLPVRITLIEPTARGQTSREALLYQVLAHELGHALGLPHTRDPRSLMCCERGAVDLADPAVREAYVQARRHPDVRSVRGELVEHYRRFWRR